MMNDHKRKGRIETQETTVSATELKNALAMYLDSVEHEREPVVVTRDGMPIAKLIPIAEEKSGDIFGFLAGSVTIHGDIVAPTGAIWDADS